MRDLLEAIVTALVLGGLIVAAAWAFVAITGFPGHGLAAFGTQGGF